MCEREREAKNRFREEGFYKRMRPKCAGEVEDDVNRRRFGGFVKKKMFFFLAVVIVIFVDS